MRTMATVPGYGITVTYDETTLTVEGNNKAARMALADPRSIPDKATLDAPVVIPRDQIADVKWKPGNMLANGRLTVTTTTGRVVKLHFRGKQQAAAADLAGALGARVS